MRKIIRIFFVLVFNVIIYSQVDTIYIKKVDIKKYQEIALEEISQKSLERNPYWFMRHPIKSTTKILSIPVFKLSTNLAENYKCGDNIDKIIEFKENPYSQEFILIYEDDEIYKDYINVKSVFDSTASQGVLYFRRHDYVENKIHKYIQDNPDAYVFIIRDFFGYWVIKDGHFYGLTSSCFLFFCSIEEVDGNSYAASSMGEEMIRDYAKGYSRLDFPYEPCGDSFIKDDFKKVYIKIIDSKE